MWRPVTRQARVIWLISAASHVLDDDLDCANDTAHRMSFHRSQACWNEGGWKFAFGRLFGGWDLEGLVEGAIWKGLWRGGFERIGGAWDLEGFVEGGI